MSQSKIICFGELLIDMFSFTDNKDGERQGIEHFSKYAGGSPAIVASAITELGSKAYFVGKLSKDTFGDFLMNYMDNKGIRMNYCNQLDGLKSSISFVSHDKDGERSFDIYRDSHCAADLAFRKDDWKEEWFRNTAIFHCGSNCQTTQSSHLATEWGMKLAQKNNVLVSYDPNIRPLIWEDDKLLTMSVHRLFPHADIVKFSEDEMHFLFPKAKEKVVVDNLFELGCKLILVTRGGKGCSAFTQKNEPVHLPGIKCKVVDTTGAGDNFIGAVLYNLAKIYTENKNKLELTYDEVHYILNFANHAAALSVTKRGGLESSPKLKEVEARLNK